MGHGPPLLELSGDVVAELGGEVLVCVRLEFDYEVVRAQHFSHDGAPDGAELLGYLRRPDGFASYEHVCIGSLP